MNIAMKSLAWSAVLLVLLLSIPTTLSGLTLFLIMTPMVVLYTMLRPVSFAVHIAIVAVAAFLLMGNAGAVGLIVGFFFLVPSIVMGHLYKKRASAKLIVIVGTLVVLAQLLTELTLFSSQYNIDFSAEISSFIEQWLSQLQTNDLLTADWAELATSVSEAMLYLLPALLILSALLIAIITHALSRRMLALSGIQTPGLPPMRAWMMRRSLLWLYFLAVIIGYATPEGGDGFWTVASANAIPVLRFFFTVQALAFFFYLASVKRWPSIVPILTAIPLLLFPPLYLIGLIDAAFPLRNYFVKK